MEVTEAAGRGESEEERETEEAGRFSGIAARRFNSPPVLSGTVVKICSAHKGGWWWFFHGWRWVLVF
jgi:hypothetical protein